MPQEWDEYGKPITAGAKGPVQEWDEHGTPIGGADASGTKGAPAYHADMPGGRRITGENLTSGYDPGAADSNPLVRGLSAIGGAALGAPGAIYHAFKDPLTPEEEADFKGHTRIPGEVTLERLTGARQLVEGGKQWADPKTRPSWEGVKSVAPEALGGGIGNYITGELMGKVTENSAANIAHTIQNVPAIADAIHAAGRSVERKLALDKGIASVYKDNVQTPLETYRGVVNREVDLHSQAILQADATFNKIRNIHGAIDTTEAATGGLKVLDELGKTNPKIEQIRQRLVGQIPFMDAKNLLTDIGSEASKMKYAGRAREAAPLWEMYDKLGDAMKDHVDSLGQQYKESFNHYRNEHRTLMEHSGLIDDLASADTPQKGLFNFSDAMNDVRGKGRQNQIAALKKDMAKYNVDTKPLDDAARQGATLRDLTNREGNIYIAKLKAMVSHPMTVAPLAIAGGIAAGSIAPGLGHILVPMLIAGKLTGMMDAVGIAKFLREVKATTRPESSIPFRNEMEGPRPVPTTPTEETGGTAPRSLPPKEATPGQADDMAAAQEGEESRQLKARQISRLSKRKGKP